MKAADENWTAFLRHAGLQIKAAQITWGHCWPRGWTPLARWETRPAFSTAYSKSRAYVRAHIRPVTLKEDHVWRAPDLRTEHSDVLPSTRTVVQRSKLIPGIDPYRKLTNILREATKDCLTWSPNAAEGERHGR